MSNIERKRAYSAAFERPATPTGHQPKAQRTLTPSSVADVNAAINDENKNPADQSRDVAMSDAHAKASSLPLRGTALQELVEIPASGGQLRPKLTLGDDDDSVDGAGAWEPAPFTIYEDPDAAMVRLSLGRGEEE